ncbi:unnamed protein product [Caenorhabditis bovis]|uniref:Uncharacterized protein n=1 Tax=Caenorhabditis bovis TaxID=2654633 RepID=A0A8S1ETG5_9PELO|nr:unnamed protein product [Caenorhabditis bovis]
MIFFKTNYSPFGAKMNQAILSMACGLFGFSMGIFAIPFVYRYVVTCCSQHLKFFSGFYFYIWMMLPIIYGFPWALTCYFFISPWDQMTEFLRGNIMDNFDLKMEEIAYIGAYYFPVDEHGVQYFNIKIQIIMLVFWIIIVYEF